jgi:cytochrome P450
MWLEALPFQKTKVALESRENYLKYMNELYNDKLDEMRQGTQSEGMDLMGQLVRSQFEAEQQAKEIANGTKKPSASAGTLSKDDILGNAFVMFVAGHETTANAIHFTIIELATNPSAQRQLQKDIDTIFGDSDPSTWNYESSINAMLASNLGACMNETLRVIPSVIEIPKMVASPGQVITLDGKKHFLPANAFIGLTAAAVHRNPRYWPTRPSKITGAEDDLDDYLPERWFRTEDAKSMNVEDDGIDAEDFGGFRGRDTSAQLFRPERGAFVPFSDGARSCLGRRVAVVKVLVALAVIFREYSIELAVDEWAADEEVVSMDEAQRARLYKTAQEVSRKKIQSAFSIITLKLHGTHVPVRLVRRGEERFVNFVDS